MAVGSVTVARVGAYVRNISYLLLQVSIRETEEASHFNQGNIVWSTVNIVYIF